jgi:predicted nucleic acid-binding protein
MPAVVSDSSVLICLAVAGQYHLLREFYGEIIVPEAVWREVTASSAPGANETVEAKKSGWLKVQNPVNASLIASLRTTLGAGESEAIALAAEIKATLLLIDESDGRKQAKALGLTVTGTIGLLILAKQQGKLPALKPVLQTLIQQNQFRLGKALYADALRQVGETP